jgi:transcriptional regulator of acetoin/glycerol metabolism
LTRIQTHGDQRHRWLEIEVQDDPRDSQRKYFCLYDVSEIYDLRHLLNEKAKFHELVGDSARMQLVYKQIQDVAVVDATVLIEGETGTGKELVARAIHYAGKRKANRSLPSTARASPKHLLPANCSDTNEAPSQAQSATRSDSLKPQAVARSFWTRSETSPQACRRVCCAFSKNEITPVGESRPRKIDALSAPRIGI